MCVNRDNREREIDEEKVIFIPPIIKQAGITINGPERAWCMRNLPNERQYEEAKRNGTLPDHSKIPVIRGLFLGLIPIEGEDDNFKISKWIF